MEKEYSQFTPELLQMMRDEEREKFLTALKSGASWGQLYQIRNTIKKLNEMIDACDGIDTSVKIASEEHGRGENPGPRN